MRHIIICDNDVDLLMLLEMILSTAGHVVKAVPDGADAIALLGQGHRCDVVITDGTMTKMHGWDVLRHTKESHPHIPVILVSGRATVPDHRSWLDGLGFAAILTKPVACDDLLAAIEQVLEPLEDV